jgi:uncharacterized tellurite resistance protein B-like protein
MSDDESRADEELRALVASLLPGTDADSIAIVTACAGLLAGVAHADRDFSEAEAAATRALLGSVHGIDAAGAGAITGAIRSRAVELSSVHRARFCRTLAALGDRDLRLHVLGLLLELAAADGEISHAEVITLRQTTGALGLGQDDYNRLQSEHRDKLSSLK